MISTHVLDTERGEPLPGLRVALYHGDELVGEQETDADGRIAELASTALESGDYRLAFDVGGDFFRRIELTLSIGDPGRHYHVPLLLAPYACTIYRGS